MDKENETCYNIQCPMAMSCQRYLPWEPCELDYESKKDGVHCEYYKQNENKEPI